MASYPTSLSSRFSTLGGKKKRVLVSIRMVANGLLRGAISGGIQIEKSKLHAASPSDLFNASNTLNLQLEVDDDKRRETMVCTVVSTIASGCETQKSLYCVTSSLHSHLDTKERYAHPKDAMENVPNAKMREIICTYSFNVPKFPPLS